MRVCLPLHVSPLVARRDKLVMRQDTQQQKLLLWNQVRQLVSSQHRRCYYRVKSDKWGGVKSQVGWWVDQLPAPVAEQQHAHISLCMSYDLFFVLRLH